MSGLFQKEESPLEKENISEIYDIVIDDKILYYELKWKSIKYSEEKGIFGRLGNLFGKTPSGGEFMSPKVIKLEASNELKITKESFKNGLLETRLYNDLYS